MNILTRGIQWVRGLQGGFDHWDYINGSRKNPRNDAEKYGVTIIPVADPSRPHWRAVRVHHLTGSENHGQHNVFCEVVGEDGQRLPLTRINILTNGNPRGSMVIDKGMNEPGTNTQMHWNDTLTVYVDRDGLPSERVAGMHTRHDDEEAGTTRGHHSYFAAFQLVPGGDTPGDDQGEDDPGGDPGDGEPDTPPDDRPGEPPTEPAITFTKEEMAVIRKALRVLLAKFGG